MSFYEERILPHLINLAMRNRQLLPYRERTVSAAEGRVLEIGMGSGLNLPFYRPAVSEIIGLDPSPRLTERARGKSGRAVGGGRERDCGVNRGGSGIIKK